jgi:hypothetical protein
MVAAVEWLKDRWLETHRLNMRRPIRAYGKWLRACPEPVEGPLFSFRQVVFNP